MLKKRRKFYHPFNPDPEYYELQGTKTELVLILIVGIIVVVYLGYKYYHPPDPVDVQQEGLTPKPPGEPAKSGHWKPGDEWHSEPHETHEPPAVSADKSYIPEGAATIPNFPPVDPNEDPVAAAYKRLDYIKNNPYAWGGVHSERATEWR